MLHQHEPHVVAANPRRVDRLVKWRAHPHTPQLKPLLGQRGQHAQPTTLLQHVHAEGHDPSRTGAVLQREVGEAREAREAGADVRRGGVLAHLECGEQIREVGVEARERGELRDQREEERVGMVARTFDGKGLDAGAGGKDCVGGEDGAGVEDGGWVETDVPDCVAVEGGAEVGILGGAWSDVPTKTAVYRKGSTLVWNESQIEIFEAPREPPRRRKRTLPQLLTQPQRDDNHPHRRSLNRLLLPTTTISTSVRVFALPPSLYRPSPWNTPYYLRHAFPAFPTIPFGWRRIIWTDAIFQPSTPRHYVPSSRVFWPFWHLFMLSKSGVPPKSASSSTIRAVPLIRRDLDWFSARLPECSVCRKYEWSAYLLTIATIPLSVSSCTESKTVSWAGPTNPPFDSSHNAHQMHTVDDVTVNFCPDGPPTSHRESFPFQAVNNPPTVPVLIIFLGRASGLPILGTTDYPSPESYNIPASCRSYGTKAMLDKSRAPGAGGGMEAHEGCY
ncbi:hypothetical protein C8F04DRAFT_1174497 [Mycena alexandri]|uniref:Uncharacterized protein n=1 Tax=Mycena alexandri TaxID=1745969 RepID=A0AAD6TJ01_9AGAR|nr:hypothetical protein C8F04DRAFT_1174497 [Mycena alexandri]